MKQKTAVRSAGVLCVLAAACTVAGLVLYLSGRVPLGLLLEGAGVLFALLAVAVAVAWHNNPKRPGR